MSNALPSGWKRGVAALFSGSLVGSALTLAVQPILTRLLPVEAFGIADLFAAILTVVFPVASLRYDDALLLPDDDDDAAALFWLAVLLSLGVCAAMAVASVWMRPHLARWPGYAPLAPLLVWMAPGLLALRAQALTEAWLTRLRRFGVLSAASAVRGGTTSAYRLGAALMPRADGAAALSVGFVAGTAAGALVQAAPLVRTPGALATRPQAARMAALARRYRRFAAFTTPATMLHNLGGRLPVLLLAWAFAPEVVGWFGRVSLVVATPLSLVGSSVSRVFFAYAAEARRSGTLPALADAFHRRLVFVGFFPTVALCAFGPDLFVAVFGDGWREAGVYAQLTAPWLMLASVAAALTVIFDVTESQRVDFLTGVAMTSGLAVALAVGVHTGSARATIAAAGLAGALLRSGQLAVLLRLARVSLRQSLAPYAVATLACLPGLAVGYAASLAGHPWVTTAGATAGAIVAYAILWRGERRRGDTTP